jgi:hypothetical protein
MKPAARAVSKNCLILVGRTPGPQPAPRPVSHANSSLAQGGYAQPDAAEGA